MSCTPYRQTLPAGSGARAARTDFFEALPTRRSAIETLLAVVVAAALVTGGCSERAPVDERSRNPRAVVRVANTDRRVDASVVAEVFLLGGDAEVTKTKKSKRGILAALNVPYSVSEAFSRYSESVKKGGYEVVDDDFEGFEAELYLRKGDDLGAVQIRRSTCEEASIVFVNVVKQAAAVFPSPSPTVG